MLPRDWQTEQIVSIAEAAQRLGKSAQCVYRYLDPGVRLPCGRRVRLECVRLGTLCTSVEAIQRWVERCSPTSDDEPERTATEAARAGQRAGDRVRARLERDRARA